MLSIEPVHVAQIPLIRKLAYEIWPAAYSSILSAGQLEYMLQLIYSEDALAAQMEEGQQFYIAYQKDNPVGFVAFSLYNINTYKLHKIYVLPQIQGQGAGKQLLHFIINKAKENGASSLILNVNRHNPAFYFYQKTGFKIAEEMDIDIGNGYFMNDYVLRLSL